MMSDQLNKKVLLSGNTESSGKNTVARLFFNYKEVLYYKQFMAVDKAKMHPHIHIVKFFKYCDDNNINIRIFKNYNTTLNYDLNIHICRNMLISNFANLIENEIEGCNNYIIYKKTPNNCCVINHQMLMETPNKCLAKLCIYLNLPFKKITPNNKYLSAYNKYLTNFEFNIMTKNYTLKELEIKYNKMHNTLKNEHQYNYIEFDKVIKC